MKGNTATVTTVNRPTLPLSALILSPDNARKTRNPNVIESIAASLRVMGMIHNIVVVPPAKQGGQYEVIAGGNRLLASQLRLANGEIGPDEPIPYDLRSREEATEISLHENVAREEMHPADEFDAIAKMFADGKGMAIDRIADALGVTPLVVERRLALTKASPKLLGLFRANEISTDQLMALCASPDHERQESVWDDAPSWNRNPKTLRRMVVESEIDASTDPRVAFIGGIEVYRAAGGEVRGDLFTDAQENAGFIADEALLERLVAEKLEAKAEKVRAEGWGWVEVVPEFNSTEFNRFGRLEGKAGKLPAEAKAEVDALAVKIAALQAEAQKLVDDNDDCLEDEDEECYEDLQSQVHALSAQIADIREAHGKYPAGAKALAGAWVSIEDGALRVDRGLVKAEDRKAITKEASVAVTGGRETNVAGRKNGSELSDALRRSLLGRRNHAAQLAVANNVRVAKVLMAVQTLELVGREGFRVGGDTVPCDLNLSDYGGSGTRTNHRVQGEDAEAVEGALHAHLLTLLGGKEPKNDAALWDLMAEKSDAELDAIIACGIAASVSLADDHASVTGKLLTALGFDVAAHVQMTADNYFGRVSKPLIFAALKEAGQDHGREALDKLKKGELAREAEKRLQGSGWVPKLIRTPAPKADKAKAATPAKKQAPSKATTKKAAPKSTTRKVKPAKKAGKAKR